MNESHLTYGQEQDERTNTVSAAQIFRIIKAYRYTILLSVFLVGLLYAVGALTYYVTAPSQRVVSLPFRLEFKGAELGRYPNGTKFSTAEILSTPVLTRVYRGNQMEEYLSFEDFKQSLYILESNPALEELILEYRAKLSDSKLYPTDRERIEAEFQAKKEGLTRYDYAINFTVPAGVKRLPRKLPGKVLTNVLTTWAELSISDKGVDFYDISILSPAIFDRNMLEKYDYIIALDMVRAKIQRVIKNIDQLAGLPGASIVRTAGPNRVSLAELRVQLDDAIKFRIQPLAGNILARGLSKDPVTSVNFLEARLRFNRLDRDDAQRRVAALHQALETYYRTAALSQQERPASSAQTPNPGTGQMVIPQLSDTFLDRIMSMGTEDKDAEYRQKLVEAIKEESLAVVPLEGEANYYESLIQSLRDFERRARTATEAELETMRQELDAVIEQAIATTTKVNEIYQILSDNLNPATILFSPTGPPTMTVERSVSLPKLALIGIVLLAATVALSIFGSLLHYRVTREAETTVEESARAAAELA